MNSKRGLSTVIVTMLMIMLVIVAAGLIWVVIANIIDTGSEQVSSGFGNLFLDLDIEKVIVDAGDISVTVKRGAGKGDISGINFIISDGDNAVLVPKPGSISELGKKTYIILYVDYETDVSTATTVSIAPTFNDSSGKETIGNIADVFEIAS